MKIKTKDLTKTALLTSLIAVGAFISIPLGPVPFTMQNFFVFMAGLLLLPEYAFLSVLTYVLIGLIGIPIFSGFKGGISYILSPTFGFLISFIVGAYVISKLAYGKTKFTSILSALIIGEIIFYAIGLPYMYLVLTKVVGTPMTFSKVLSVGMTPFIVPDLVKAIIAAIIAPKIRKAI